MDKVKLPGTAKEGKKRGGAQGMFRAEMTLCNSVVVDTCHYTFVQTQRLEDTKSEPSNKLWTVDDYRVSTQVHPW